VEKKDYEVVVSTPYFLAVEISTINEQVVLNVGAESGPDTNQ
jgi:hypothetical protein